MTPEIEGMVASLRSRLDATDADLDNSPLWLFLAKHVSTTLADFDQGQCGEEHIVEMYKVCMDLDRLRGRK
jgi:hypothetical protein